MYSAFDSAASCRAGGSAAGGGRRKEKIRKRAIDVARESGYQLDDRYQRQVLSLQRSIPGRFCGRRIKMFPGSGQYDKIDDNFARI